MPARDGQPPARYVTIRCARCGTTAEIRTYHSPRRGDPAGSLICDNCGGGFQYWPE